MLFSGLLFTDLINEAESEQISGWCSWTFSSQELIHTHALFLGELSAPEPHTLMLRMEHAVSVEIHDHGGDVGVGDVGVEYVGVDGGDGDYSQFQGSVKKLK